VTFVVEDDGQNGVDHVDRHHTIAQLVSLYIQRGSNDSSFYSQVNLVRTIKQILGLPPMNQFDLAATPMFSCFDDTYDLSPFESLSNQIPPDEMDQPLSALKGDQYESIRNLN
jgi:hypothetical protein